ncbi:MAG: FAD:protein FMN transferase [Gemmatimonadota bacterium]|nr:FAD:protein FMN transferase [Gemmatimonadota bacterium]
MLFVALLHLHLAGVPGPAASDAVWVDREAVVMGTSLRIELEAPTEADARRSVDRLFDAVRELDRRWTTWGPESGLSRANAAETGVAVPLDRETYRILSRAWDLTDRTDGAFDPTVGALVDAWDLRGEGREPGIDALDRALASTGRGCFDLSAARRTLTRRCPDAWIDLGAIGKGAALATIRDLLEQDGIAAARVDFGGQLLIHGAEYASTVQIADPRARRRAVFEWRAVRGSVATTSQSERWIRTASGRRGHVIDPRTGVPVEPWGSVTVHADDPVEADALATALFVMGPDEGSRWLAARPEVEALFLLAGEDGVIACGRESLVARLLPVLPDARRSELPLLTSDLRRCS